MPPAEPLSRPASDNAGVAVQCCWPGARGSPGRNYLCGGLRKTGRSKSRVIADADAARCIFLRQNVIRNRARSHAKIGEGKVFCNDAAPAIGAELYSAWLGIVSGRHSFHSKGRSDQFVLFSC